MHCVHLPGTAGLLQGALVDAGSAATHAVCVCQALAAPEGHSCHATGQTLPLPLPLPVQRASARRAGSNAACGLSCPAGANVSSAPSSGQQGTEPVTPCAAGLVLASLLPMAEARQLGVDAAQADAQSADDEAGSPHMQLEDEDALAARWGRGMCKDTAVCREHAQWCCPGAALSRHGCAEQSCHVITHGQEEMLLCQHTALRGPTAQMLPFLSVMLCGSPHAYSFHFNFGAFIIAALDQRDYLTATTCLLCRIACCTMLQAAVHAFRLEKCWPPDWQLLLDGRQVRFCWCHADEGATLIESACVYHADHRSYWRQRPTDWQAPTAASVLAARPPRRQQDSGRTPREAMGSCSMKLVSSLQWT